MEYSDTNSENRAFFHFTGLFFLGLVLVSSILAILGIFYVEIIFLYITIGIVFLARLFLKNKLFSKIERHFWVISLASFGFILLFSAFSTPTIFSGRDQGSYSEAAIRLSQNHKLEFSTPVSEEFFKIYGPGKALDFPGFNYTKKGSLVTSFPVGYISWLAVFYSFFGLAGLIVANAAAFFIFSIFFYLLARVYLNKMPALISCFLLFVSFIFSWFFKFTLSENLALPIIFFGLYQLALYLENWEKTALFSAFLSFSVLLFVKTEALGFLAVLAIAIYLMSRKNEKVSFSFLKNKKVTAIFLVILFFYLWNIFFSGGDYYKTIGKAFFHAVSGQGARIASSSNLFFEFWYTTKILALYNLLGFIFLGICGFAYFLSKKEYKKIAPFFVLLPTFFYLFQPSISDDHPWMLRRFVFSVFPICVLYSVMFLDRSFKKRKCSFYLLTFLLLLSNLPLFMLHIKTSENNGMLEKIGSISKNFSEKDLVLVDQKATGDGFSMMTGPLSFLYGKQAVYFINPDDISRISLEKFEHIYFIVPNNNLSLYKKSGLMEKLAPIKDYSISTIRLDIQAKKNGGLISSPVELPIEKDAAVSGKIYKLR
ncbi:MAG TPA: hypothetical protein P5262_03845 [Candidatus Moranbacteria bacterium]|nr:hypothetical protein [Candidatus Moranbacteria bacterium]